MRWIFLLIVVLYCIFESSLRCMNNVDCVCVSMTLLSVRVFFVPEHYLVSCSGLLYLCISLLLSTCVHPLPLSMFMYLTLRVAGFELVKLLFFGVLLLFALVSLCMCPFYILHHAFLVIVVVHLVVSSCWCVMWTVYLWSCKLLSFLLMCLCLLECVYLFPSLACVSTALTRGLCMYFVSSC